MKLNIFKINKVDYFFYNFHRLFNKIVFRIIEKEINYSDISQ